MCTAAVLLHYDLCLNIEHYTYLVLEAYFNSEHASPTYSRCVTSSTCAISRYKYIGGFIRPFNACTRGLYTPGDYSRQGMIRQASGL